MSVVIMFLFAWPFFNFLRIFFVLLAFSTGAVVDNTIFSLCPYLHFVLFVLVIILILAFLYSGSDLYRSLDFLSNDFIV